MNTTININLAGMAFQIDDDAYKMLRSYLESIERELTSEDSSEVMRDIESRVAELFRDLCRQQRAEVVTAEMVRAVIAQLGKPADFKDEEEAEQSSFSAMLKRKLYRDPSNKIIAGVCSGLGHWFGIDAIWVRLIFLLCLLLWGVTLPIYLVLWLVMPEAQTAAQRLSMRGEQATVENIEREISEQRTSESGSAQGCLWTGVKIVVLCIGLFFLFIAATIFTAVITGLTGALSGLAVLSPLGALSALFSGNHVHAIVLSILIVIVIGLPIFCLVAAIFKYANGERVTSRSVWIALVIWLLSLIGATGLGIYELINNEQLWNELVFEQIDDFDDFDGDSTATASGTSAISVTEFHSIVVSGAADIRLTQAEECYIEGKESDLKKIEVVDSVLYVSTKDNLRRGVHLWIQAKELRSLEMQGATKVKTPQPLSIKRLSLRSEGASEVDLKLDCNELIVNAEGATDIELEGRAQSLTIDVEGASKVDAENLVAERAVVKTAGPTKVELNVTEHIEAYPSALSIIEYRGEPTVAKHGKSGKLTKK